MIFPLPVFEAMVYVALVVSACTPLVLLALLYRDWKENKLW